MDSYKLHGVGALTVLGIPFMVRCYPSWLHGFKPLQHTRTRKLLAMLAGGTDTKSSSSPWHCEQCSFTILPLSSAPKPNLLISQQPTLCSCSHYPIPKPFSQPLHVSRYSSSKHFSLILQTLPSEGHHKCNSFNLIKKHIH